MAELGPSIHDCDDPYTIRYFRGAVPINTPQNVTQLTWRRVMDGVSTTELVHETDGGGGECCADLGLLEPFADGLAVHRGNDLVWAGTLTRVEYGKATVSVRAMDQLGWLLVRNIHTDQNHVSVDLTDIFEAYWRDAIDLDIIPYDLELTPTGILASRSVLANEHRTAWEPVKEMLDTGLDATAIGHRIVAGKLDFGSIDLTTDDFQGDPRVVKDGDQYGNRVIVKGEGGIIGIAGGFGGDPPYPLVELVRDDQQIQDQPSADSAAQSILDFNDVVPRYLQTPEGTALILERAGGIQNLIPGMLVNMHTIDYCYDRSEQYRLSQLSVEVLGRQESVRPVFQPVGAAA